MCLTNNSAFSDVVALQIQADRRERLRKLAMETIDLSKVREYSMEAIALPTQLPIFVVCAVSLVCHVPVKYSTQKLSNPQDPYIMRNHIGSFECKLCLTLHNNEGNYLAHTQGKRHQSNLRRRGADVLKVIELCHPPTSFS